MATYVISDLHGQYKMFMKLLEKAAFSDADKLYMLGDAIDRGPDGIKILQHVMKAPNMEFLLGNHEFMMLNALDPEGSAPMFYTQLPGRDAILWTWSNGGDKTFAKYKRLRKAQRLELLEWLFTRNLSTRIEVGQKSFLLTHSFFREDLIDVPYKDMDYQTVWKIVWPTPFRADLYIDTKEYSVYEDRTFIIGHVPTIYADEAHFPRPLSTYRTENIIVIDGGCGRHNDEDAGYKGGILLRLDDMEEFTITFAELEGKKA